MKKPRSDSVLDALPTEQQAALCDWLLGGMPYAKARALLSKEFGAVTSSAALSRFYSSVCTAALLARRQRAVSTAEEVAAEAAKTPGKFDAATIDAIKQKAFEMSISPQSKPGDVQTFFNLVLRARDQDLDAKQLQLNLDKFQFDAAKACLAHLPALREIAKDPGMDDAAKLQAVRKRLFGETPA
jgi:hypothetical protein